MYEYFYSFTTSKQIDNMDEYTDEIFHAISEFNRKSLTSHVYKHIREETVNISKSKIEFHFQIATCIDDNISLRPLHIFSKILIEVEGLSGHVKNKRFLKPILMYKVSGPDKIEHLSDVEVVKEIMDIYFDKNERKEKKELKKKINEMITAYVTKK